TRSARPIRAPDPGPTLTTPTPEAVTMPINFTEPGAEVGRVAREPMTDLVGRRQLRVAALRDTESENVSLGDPHPAHNVGLDDLVVDRPPSDGALTGWRYLVSTDGEVVASAEVATDATGSEPRFSNVNQG